MKILSLLLLFSIVLSPGLNARKLAEFNENFKGTEIHFDNKQLYIVDKIQRKIHIYLRRDFKKISEFGRHGMGPGEFNNIGTVIITNNTININSFPKLLFFSKQGTFMKEINGKGEAGGFRPLGNNFVGSFNPPSPPKNRRAQIQYCIYDTKLVKKKDIFLTDFTKFALFPRGKSIIYWIRDCIKESVYNDRLYIGTTDKGFYFAVFDNDGQKLYEINRDYKKQKITRDEQKRMLDNEKKRVGKEQWKQITAHREYVFPEYYPAYQKFFIDNGKLYVIKFQKKNTREILILDLKGNLLRKRTISNPEILEQLVLGRFAFRMGKLYVMLDNAETEMWELHVANID